MDLPDLLASVLSAIHDPLIVADARTGRIELTNTAADILFGYDPGEAIDLELAQLVPAYQMRPDSEVGDGPLPPMELAGVCKSGESIPLHLSLSPVDTAAGVRLVAIARPVPLSPTITAAGEVASTGASVPPRMHFLDRLRQAISQGRRHGWLVSIIVLDIDQFKLVNESLGYDAGDALLSMVLARLRSCVRDYDTVGRFSADEFLLILMDMAEADGVHQAAQRILDNFKTPFVVGDQEIMLTARMGISRFPEHGDAEKDLLGHAFLAKRHAKDRFAPYLVYDDSLSEPVAQQLRIKTLLYKAAERGEFFLMYQPQVDLVTGEVEGVEALIRWRSAELGYVMPLQFIPIAEETGLIAIITDWVLRNAAAQAKAWEAEGLPPIRVAVNLSGRNFRQGNLVSTIQSVLAENRLDPSRLEVEITENVLMENLEATRKMMDELAAMGMPISLDDFGTGYSSLGYLKRFPLRTLKVDRSFVRDIEHDPSDAMIVQAIIALAHSLKLKVVAEGVETESQLAYLRELGCDQVQGFYFSKPLAADGVSKMLRHGLDSLRRMAN